MDDNTIFVTLYKDHISDLVLLVSDILNSLLKLESQQIKSLLYSKDKKGYLVINNRND